MIPKFPDTIPISLASVRDISTILSGHLPYSSFNALWLTCQVESNRVARFGDGLLVSRGQGADEHLSILCRQADSRERAVLSEYLGGRELNQALTKIPQCSLSPLHLAPHALERRDLFDYIVTIDQLVAPTSAPARELHQMARAYVEGKGGATRIMELPLESQSLRDEIMGISMDWLTSSKSDDPGRANEVATLARCLERHREFELVAVVALSDSGTMLGFTINEPMHDGWYMGHFGKVYPRTRGLTVLLEVETARAMARRGCSVMNFQEDLGNLGLRKMKQAWGPAGFLKVYDIRPADGDEARPPAARQRV
ncbi:MAG: phosphatidylglycerol lysyltransferase domain-containing protein [Burkholderiales bacterium]